MWTLSFIKGRHTEKLLPKPKLHSQEETHCATVPNPDDVQPVPAQTDNFDEGSIPAVPLDDMIDFSSMEFDDSVPIDPALEISGFVETSQLNEQNTVSDLTNVGVQHCNFHAFIDFVYKDKFYCFIITYILIFTQSTYCT